MLGLVALLAGGCAEMSPGRPAASITESDWAHARTVTIVMAEYRFVPDRISFERGVTYRLQLENRGAELHEFTAPGFLAAIELRDPTVLNAGKNEVVVEPRTAKAVYFVARRAGSYELTCADHDWAGMVGTIVIE